ncbi:MAG: SHOCT domain-containing protein [Terracidiphilus sp.]
MMLRSGRRRGTGLARTMARTALVAGTAQTVAGRVAMRQQAANVKKDAAQGTAASPGMLTDEVVDQLKKLAELRDAGVLSDKEFSAKKAKLLP